MAMDESGRQQLFALGVRMCPNGECNGQLLFQKDTVTGELATFPSQRIDFDASDVPASVAECLAEAIDCHANNNNVAAAIMVRKTLEEMCEDQGAKGGNLKAKIKDLSTKIVVPQQLVNGMDALRLLGNDAAHIEAQVFSEVGPKELSVAIKFTKELLKNVYQYGSLLKELEDLKAAAETETE
jgi:hypothetical protein